MTKFGLRAICLSDLEEIVKIHRGNRLSDNPGPGLTETFGLPLGLVHAGNRVLGYTYVCIDEKNEIDVRSSFAGHAGESDRLKIEETLMDFSRKVLCLSFGNGKSSAMNVTEIKNSVRVLVDWINRTR